MNETMTVVLVAFVLSACSADQQPDQKQFDAGTDADVIVVPSPTPVPTTIGKKHPEGCSPILIVDDAGRISGISGWNCELPSKPAPRPGE